MVPTQAPQPTATSLFSRARRGLGRIWLRLLAVNLVVVTIPLAGLEFARVYEKQLLDGLERDMQNQATLVRTLLEASFEGGKPLAAAETERLLVRAAQRTRTRIRIVLPEQGVVSDSHRHGPPEGPEAKTPMLARGRGSLRRLVETSEQVGVDREARAPEPPIMTRDELRRAFAGVRATATRVADKAVFLFLAEPVRRGGVVEGAVYVTRSTQPVLVELHRVRSGLIWVFVASLAFTSLVTLALGLSISKPLVRLSRAAQRITHGDFGVAVPLDGGGEISELAHEFADMTRKLEARHRYISEFAADVAHEFKSPLTSIRGAAELLAEGAADDPEARTRFLNNIRLDAGRLDRLVSRLLELSRIDASDALPQLVDLRALVQRAVARSEGPNAPIQLDYQSTLPAIVARESDLETALLNLLDNAQRFSPEGKPVSVSVHGGSGDDFVVLRVRDHGSGISPEHLPRVFDRFFTTDSERDGTGLGLSIVKSVANAHGGSVSIASVPGHGTSVELRLPVGLSARRGLRAGMRALTVEPARS